MEWLDENNLKSVVTVDPQLDCQGFLSTLVHHCGKSWKKYYCVLKDARLYFFVDSVTRFANGNYFFYLHIYINIYFFVNNNKYFHFFQNRYKINTFIQEWLVFTVIK